MEEADILAAEMMAASKSLQPKLVLDSVHRLVHKRLLVLRLAAFVLVDSAMSLAIADSTDYC